MHEIGRRQGVMGELVVSALIVVSMAIMVHILVSTLWRVDHKIKVLQERITAIQATQKTQSQIIAGLFDDVTRVRKQWKERQ